MKVLISAYAAEPLTGSEHGAGWVWSLGASEHHAVHVLTRRANQAAIEEFPRSVNLTIHYLDLPGWLRWWKKGNRGVHAYYLIWQLLSFVKAWRLNRTESFDVAHHLTFAVDWLPSGLSFLRSVPLVWGPVGGVTKTPKELLTLLSTKGRMSEQLRNVATDVCRSTLAFTTIRSAAVVVAQNADSASTLARMRGEPVLIEPNVALSEADLVAVVPGLSCRIGIAAGVRTAVLAGRLVELKAPLLALRVIARAGASWRLIVAGDGPLRADCERLARELLISDSIEFRGQIPRSELLKLLSDSDVLLHPCLHEAAGWVVAEATSLGVPVVGFRHGGLKTILHGADGGLVEPSAPEIAISQMAEALNSCRRGSPTHRWSKERIPFLVDVWYSAARRQYTGGVKGKRARRAPIEEMSS